ncbi:citrate lyase holo-[acyl-carrier protein] synthase [Klebsiella sp. I138]|uniref:citrate lyase holo-[acyl-carrier protein] synthase n=1 Tax=Klebsiella sp. I138 TaxID=2755385 RepID=UPI003DA8932B
MSVDTPARAGASVETELAAKEQRAARQADWLGHYQQPVISLTLVTPGAVKDSIRYRNMMGVALQACDQLLWKRRWKTLDRQVLWLPTGPEALWCVEHSASDVNALCTELVQTHPLGRLWNIEVICPQQGQLMQDESAGRCLLCDDAAQTCERQHRHDAAEVAAHVEQMIDAWFSRD